MKTSRIPTLLFLCSSAGLPAADAVLFNRDIRPILAEACLPCHGPDPGARKAGLRLDGEEHAFLPAKSGKPVIVRGAPDESPLVQRILSADETHAMPPPEARRKLTDAEKRALARWVSEGARYEEHWALVPPRSPPVPRNGYDHPVDAFLAQGLAPAGLAFSPEADRRALIRRASLDLTGLPPEPAAVEDFVSDGSSGAWDRVIERLLASPHYGEERARRWLDVARYADTQGLHHDDYREIWPYRDWVVRAFNEDMPFDRFTLEQLAGDLLPEARDSEADEARDARLVATGYLRSNVSTAEGGVIAEEVAADVAKDRIEALGLGWLGLTIQCAQCHDHKFDPVTQRDFYQLAAIFRNGEDLPVEPAHRDNVEPTLLVPSPAHRARLAELRPEIARLAARIEEAEAALSADPAALEERARAAARAAGSSAPALRLVPGDGGGVDLEHRGKVEVAAAGGGEPAAFAVRGRGGLVLRTDAGRFDGRSPFSVLVRAKVPEDARGALLARMEPARDHLGWDLLLDNRRLQVHLVAKWPDDAIKVVAKDRLPANAWFSLEVTYDGSGTAEGMQVWLDGRRLATDTEQGRLSGIAASAAPLRIGSRDGGEWLGDFAVAEVVIREGEAARARPIELALEGGLAGSPAGPGSARGLARAVLETSDAPYREAVASLARARRKEGEIEARSPRTRIQKEKPGKAVARILKRGRYDQPGEEVEGDVPHVFPRIPDGAPRNRLGLARWLLRPDHPLTARVFVNRVWQDLMGTGIVASSWDFGVMGDAPSHPELLDWLAVRFQEGGWKVKDLLRIILTSAAYRQSARVTPDRLEKDPANRLLSRGPRHRLDGEALRDLALAASGLLIRDIGGPPARPYQPPNVWEAVAMLDSNTRVYVEDQGRGLYRRSLYTFVKRAAHHPAMDAFNTPSREVCTIRRERTNTPLQALVLMNDPQFFEASRRMAENALSGAGGTDARLDHIALRLLARPLDPDERSIAREVLDRLLQHYRARPEDARALIAVGASAPDASLAPDELAAWTLTPSQLLCLDATLNQ